jgi:hypothetical protein
MKRIIEFKNSSEHYKADACIVWCFDDRFSDLLEETKKKFNLKRIDQVEVAGGAKELAGSGSGTDFVLDQVYKSIKLHHTPLIILMVHKDCGAYGKLDVEDENEFFSGQLRAAKNNLHASLGANGQKAEIRAFLADFEGLSEVI